jgi:ribosomal protein S18 acetylase RimI-like enzyme
MTLPDFPPAGRGALPLSLPSLALRAASREDLPFLQLLHAEQRLAELGALPLPPDALQAFCEAQFRMQHVQYLAGFADADFWIVEQAGVPVGRLYLDRSTPRWRVIDITLTQVSRGQGLGGALIGAVQQAARAAGAETVALHVLRDNVRAQALYRRLGFDETAAADEIQIAMTWTP